jgi:hypothetical protein
MKKNEVKKLTRVKLKKLRLSRETLQPLMSSDAQKVMGGYTPDTVQMSPECDSENVCPATT